MAGCEAGGPETYEHCLVRLLSSIDRQNEYHVFCLSRAARDSFQAEQENLRYHVLWPKARWISIPAALPLLLHKHGVQLYHATFIPPPISPADYVFTMHCYSNFLHPEFYEPKVLWRLNKSITMGLNKARVVVCVSECVRDLVAHEFKLPSERLAVVYNGVGENFHPMPRLQASRIVSERYGLFRPYMLFVGQLKARKNIVRILEAFHRFRRETHNDLVLVLAGRRSWTCDGIDETIERLHLRDAVVELGHIGWQDLPALYNAAEMLVFPSLWEGFGIPVIEAIACGTPVITSNLSALPEVAGGSALLVDPYSVDDLAGAMQRLVDDSDLRKELRAKGLERARKFSWKNTAEQTLAVYGRAGGFTPSAIV